MNAIRTLVLAALAAGFLVSLPARADGTPPPPSGPTTIPIGNDSH